MPDRFAPLLSLGLVVTLGACATPAPPAEEVAPPVATAPPAPLAPAPAPVVPPAPPPRPELAPAPQPPQAKVEPAPQPAPRAPAPQASLLFMTDSAELTAAHRKTLAGVAATARDPLQRVVLECHVDGDGSRELNVALAQRRGEMVKRELVALGVSERRIRVLSFGEEIGGNGPAAGRVDIRLQKSVR